jgi:two-component system, OmpR family, alkaline phosphatase synthesis response regulator PhoP
MQMMKVQKVLVCDDDPDILEMVSTMLSALDYEVETEPDSSRIFTTIERYQPDKIILDLWMPVFSGDQILQALKSDTRTASIPVIVFSASRAGKDIAIAAGADYYIDKPFNLDELVSALEQ